jgi:hypothetical protein
MIQGTEPRQRTKINNIYMVIYYTSIQMICSVDRYKDFYNYINTKQDADTKYNDFISF